MTYAATILADSISPDGVRLTTMEVTMPRIVLAEFNTHRMFSRNSASSRAIPVEKMLKRVMEEPYIPTTWGKNQKGMQSEEEFDSMTARRLEEEWLYARDSAVKHAEFLLKFGLHKQFTNRLLEPFMWHTVIVTATEWDNFFHLRCHKDAHPDIRIPAELMREQYESHKPRELSYSMWHLPLVKDSEIVENSKTQEFDMCKVSIGRCARVSYLTHEGKRDPKADIELADRLLASGHMSPFEHVARPMAFEDLPDGYDPGDQKEYFSGNFRGWVQYRKTIPGEEDMLANQ